MAEPATAVLAGHPAPTAPPALAEAGARGRLVVADRVVQRIAEAAAAGVDGVAPRTSSDGSLTGNVTTAVGGALGRTLPRASCVRAGSRVRVEIEVATLWPRPAAEVAARVRDRVAERLEALAGVRVDAVAVTVAKVVLSAAPTRARVR
ncbi:Asp23/Gls24 family envelope stress response protein [Kineococcus rubinsiae]|uniref:Asp23/Gls24 family envelope stress response protein n=1 Tax=Kineococcus rubinsiae TaxID=2609562 RepID=UPI00142F54E8|nr:Asp23/Gls24 family envelope stress response protein [Kineococcus rubinsiae]NIZ92443.1 Asp23/Gls24 family envelope stress response protein [Kineococcus rubinsiae]